MNSHETHIYTETRETKQVIEIYRDNLEENNYSSRQNPNKYVNSNSQPQINIPYRNAGRENRPKSQIPAFPLQLLGEQFSSPNNTATPIPTNYTSENTDPKNTVYPLEPMSQMASHQNNYTFNRMQLQQQQQFEYQNSSSQYGSLNTHATANQSNFKKYEEMNVQQPQVEDENSSSQYDNSNKNTSARSEDNICASCSRPLTIVTSGFFIWNIPNFQNELMKCKANPRYRLISPEFSDQLFSYSIRANIFLNGSLQSDSGQIAVYIVICKGQYDALLTWPFNHTVKIELVNQSRSDRPVIVSIAAEDENTSVAFARPTQYMNSPIGANNFCSNQLSNEYLINDTIFFRFTILKDKESYNSIF